MFGDIATPCCSSGNAQTTYLKLYMPMQDDGHIPNAVDQQIFETLAKIRKRDRSIYDSDTQFFEAEAEAEAEADKETAQQKVEGPKKSKRPMYLKDVIAQQVGRHARHGLVDPDQPPRIIIAHRHSCSHLSPAVHLAPVQMQLAANNKCRRSRITVCWLQALQHGADATSSDDEVEPADIAPSYNQEQLQLKQQFLQVPKLNLLSCHCGQILILQYMWSVHHMYLPCIRDETCSLHCMNISWLQQSIL